MLAGLPKGALSGHDELMGWLKAHVRYNGDSTSFWLESTSGLPYTVDRVKHGEAPLVIPHLCLSVFGTIQPDRVVELLNRADDGLVSRFLWFWPDAAEGFEFVAARPPQRRGGGVAGPVGRPRTRARRRQDEPPQPVVLPFDAEAATDAIVAHARRTKACAAATSADPRA